MLKKFGVKMLVVALIAMMSYSDALGQTRIRFARGRTSTSLSGTIMADGSRSYVLRASNGQTLTATVSCGNGKCDFAEGAVNDTQYSQYIESNGDVYITLHNHGNRATRFTITVSIQ
jgi:hypothetical protein